MSGRGAGDRPLTYAGEYDVARTYLARQVVTSGGSVYMAVAMSTGQAPTDATYWLPLGGGHVVTVLPLASSGWKYLTTTLGDATDYSDPGFNDSGWSSGQGAFGNGAGPHAVNTAWAEDTRIWIRRTIPAVTLSDGEHVLIFGLLDNTCDIYWNGTLIASVAGSDNGDATFGPIPVPNHLVGGGTHVLAVRASDDATVSVGDVSLLDIRVATGVAPYTTESMSGILGVVTANVVHATEDWNVPTLLNSWSNYGSGYAPAGYYKDETGRIYLRGLIIGGANGSVAFVLPTGYRPQYSAQFPAVCDANANVHGAMTIGSDGNVIVSNRTTLIDIGSVSFRVAP